MSDSEQLLPCPFCGGKANGDGCIHYSRQSDNSSWADGSPVTEAFFANCTSCGIRNGGIFGGFQTRELAIAAWNTRTRSDELAEMFKGVSMMFEGFACWSGNSHLMEMAATFEAGRYAIKSDRAGSVAGRSEHRLSGEQYWDARADHAAGSRSSDGSDTSAPMDVVKLVARAIALAHRWARMTAAKMTDQEISDEVENSWDLYVGEAKAALSAVGYVKLRYALQYARNLVGPDEIIDAALGAGDQNRG